MLARARAEAGEVEKGHFIPALIPELWDCPSSSHQRLLRANLLGLEWFLPLQDSHSVLDLSREGD